uniref:Uncharacterized protein n=1 Tax=Palpitomonas bilix TaxID=652834 RepID=A0A7S3D1Z6_9EUKA
MLTVTLCMAEWQAMKRAQQYRKSVELQKARAKVEEKMRQVCIPCHEYLPFAFVAACILCCPFCSLCVWLIFSSIVVSPPAQLPTSISFPLWSLQSYTCHNHTVSLVPSLNVR